MIQPQDLFNINFYQKLKFHGSYRGMNYRIEKITEEDGDHFCATTWPGPYNFDTTDDSLKETAFFPFTNEGLAEVCAYLNEVHVKNYPQT